MDDFLTARNTVYTVTGFVLGENPDRDTYIEFLLDTFTALKGQITYYRPWYAAAFLLEQDLDSQTLLEYDGTKFSGLITPIKSLYSMQSAFDLANELIVPDGTSAQKALDRLCGCSESYPVMSINTI